MLTAAEQLAETYERNMRNAGRDERDYVFEDVEESFYVDGVITMEQFEKLERLYELLNRMGS